MVSGCIQAGQGMDHGGHDPGCRVGQQEHALGREPCEDGGKPYDPEQACSGQGDDHRGDGITESSHGTHDDFHDAAQEIGRTDPQKACLSGFDDRRVRRIDGQKRGAEEVDADSHDQPDNGHKAQTVVQSLPDPFRFSGAGVLAGEAYDCLMYCIHGNVYKLFDAGGGAVSCYNDRSERIDGGLDQYIGEGKERALYAGRQADLHHPAQTSGLDVEFFHIQAARTVHPAQADQDQDGADALGEDGGERHACHVHMKDDDKEQVEHHVDDACHGQKVQRPFGISGGAQDGAAEVISHGCGHTDKNNLQIQGCLVEHVKRSPHPDQQGFCKEYADSDQRDTGDQAYGDRRVDVIPGSLIVSASKGMADGYVGPDGQPDKEVDQQVGKRAGRSHGCQGLIACETADHDHVRRIEQKLQAAGEH